MSAKRNFGLVFVGSALWSVIRWALEDYGYIQLGQDAFTNRGRIVKGVWWVISHSGFGPVIAVGCLAIYLILEFHGRRRTKLSRLPTAPAGPDVKGFLDYKIEARRAFEDLMVQLGRYVDVHNEWTAILASAVAKSEKLDAKAPFFADKQADLKAKELTARPPRS